MLTSGDLHKQAMEKAFFADVERHHGNAEQGNYSGGSPKQIHGRLYPLSGAAVVA